MKKKSILTILVLMVGVLLITACSDSSIKGIEKIELSFSGEGVDEYKCTLIEKDNLKEAINLFESLEKYRSPEDSKSKPEDVNYKITYTDGKVKERVYVKVKPVATLFEKVFKSKEVIKQWTTK